MDGMKRDRDFNVDMNLIAAVAPLLLLTITLLCVEGAPNDSGAYITLPTSSLLSDVESRTLTQRKDNSSREMNLSLIQSEEPSTTTLDRSASVNVNPNFVSRKYTSAPIEAEDMEESFVRPEDDDNDDSIKRDQPQHATAIVPPISLVDVTTANVKIIGIEKQAIQPVNIFPNNPDKRISDLPLDIQRKFTHDTYFLGIDGVRATKVPDVSIVPTKSTTMESFDVPNVQDSMLTLGTREEIMKKHLQMIPLESKKQNENLPAGVIGLISAVVFTTVVVAAFIGLIGWKRYQEYIHGHRELLVNDFDSNDISNFEL